MRKGPVVALVFALVMGAWSLAPAYQGGEVKNGGAITGAVKLAGTPPKPEKLTVNKDEAVCGKEAKFAEGLVVAGNKGIKNAVVSLVEINAGKPMAQLASKSELDQNGCAYKPHVVIVPVGSTLKVLNNDGILHNIHTYSTKNPSVNIAQPKFKKQVDMKFQAAEVIKVACDAHSWMTAWIVVADHPYYALSDENGNFKLDNVPPGNYKLQIWHESLGKVVKDVTVKEKAESKVAVEMAKK